MFKETWDFSIPERKEVMARATVLQEYNDRGIEKTVVPYNINAPYQETTSDVMVASSLPAYKNFFDAIDHGYFHAMYENGDILLDAVPLPREFFGDILIHLMSVETYMIVQDDDFIGDNKNNGAVYLQTTDGVVIPNDDVLSPGKRSVRLLIDVDSLFAHKRRIFIDEESLTSTPEEYKSSFFMYGGIPKSSIIKAQVIQIGRDKIVDNQQYVFDEGKDNQERKEYNRRLQSVEQKLQNRGMIA